MADTSHSEDKEDAVPGRVKEKFCQPCSRKDDDNVADVFCEDCAEYQCNECAKVHQLYPVMSKHKLVHVSKGSLMYDMKGLDQCEKHQKRLKFICEEDGQLCCSSCAIAYHRSCHNVVDIEEKAKVEIPDFTKVKKELLDIESKANDVVNNVRKTSEKLKAGVDDIFDQLKQMQDKVNKMFEELRSNLSTELTSFQEHARNELYLKEASCERINADVQQSLSVIDDVIQKGTSAQKLIISKYLKEKVEKLQEKGNNDYSELKDVVVTFRFDDNIPLPPSPDVRPGKLTAMFVPFSADPEGKDQEKKEHKINLKLLASIDLKQGESDVKEPLYNGLDFLEDGRLVAVDIQNKKCLVYDMKLKKLGSLELSDHPQGVVAVSEDEVAVTYAGSLTIQILKVDKNSGITLSRSFKVTHKYESVCMMDKEDLLVGCYDNTQPIRVVSISGEEKELGIKFPEKTYAFASSRCTYIKNRNKVVLTDRYAHTVYIYDIASNTRVEVKDKKVIKEPRGVTVVHADSFFVCSKNTNSIVRISHKGQILSSHGLDMELPMSVCVSKDMTKLAVSNSATGKKKLHLYSIETISD